MSGSTISILYNAAPITGVIYAKTWFESLAAAAPGQCEIHVRDPNQTLDFVTGKALSMTLDGKALWTGYLTSVSRTYALPVLDTVNVAPAAVEGRIWVLRGVDLNILFDKRVVRNTADYYHQLPNFDASRYDGDLISNDLVTFLDIGGDSLDTSTYVDNVAKPADPLDEAIVGEGAWVDQGSTWRKQMEDFALFTGSVWYFDAARNLHNHAIEDVEATWGFSDQPNGSTTIGFRELEAVEDGSVIVNDAMVWGGSEWAGSGQTVFHRTEDAASQSAHGRWQYAEVKLGDENYKSQREVTARANVIVKGTPSGTPLVQYDPGLRFAQWDLSLVWHSVDVPGNVHLTAGQIVTTSLWVMSDDGGTTPLILGLPLRRVRMTFPTLDDEGDPYVRFEGNLSLQSSDPKTLWGYLRYSQRQRRANVIVGTADSTTTTPSYGLRYSDAPIPAPNGTNTVFTLNPSSFAYIGGTLQVFRDGLLQIPGVDYSESDPGSGEFTFASAPSSSALLWVFCRLS